jgi:hypothetical protein
MLQLLKTEIKKFKSNSTIILLGGFFLALMPFVILTLKGILKDATGPVKAISEIYDLPMIWEYQGYAGSWLVFFFLGFMVLQMFTNEVSQRTMRQNIIFGYTKREFFTAKVIVVICLSIIATLLYTLSAAIIGMIHTPGFDFELLLDNNWATTRFFISTLGTLFFALLIAVVFRKGGLSMFIYFAYPLILEPILRWLTIWLQIKIDKPEWTLMNYYPMNTIEDLMVFPLIRTTSDFININAKMTLVHSYATAMIVGSIFAALFLFLAWKSFEKSDI